MENDIELYSLIPVCPHCGEPLTFAEPKPVKNTKLRITFWIVLSLAILTTLGFLSNSIQGNFTYVNVEFWVGIILSTALCVTSFILGDKLAKEEIEVPHQLCCKKCNKTWDI